MSGFKRRWLEIPTYQDFFILRDEPTDWLVQVWWVVPGPFKIRVNISTFDVTCQTHYNPNVRQELLMWWISGGSRASKGFRFTWSTWLVRTRRLRTAQKNGKPAHTDTPCMTICTWWMQQPEGRLMTVGEMSATTIENLASLHCTRPAGGNPPPSRKWTHSMEDYGDKMSLSMLIRVCVCWRAITREAQIITNSW